MANPAKRLFRFAICNEIWGSRPLAEACTSARELGYEGIELAPHTLAEDATLLGTDERNRIRKQMRDSGMAFVGLHWLLVSPPGLHICSGDTRVREATWAYVRRAIDLCAELGGGSETVMVFGSPKQRSATGSIAPSEARGIWKDRLARAAEIAASAGVTLLVEPIPAKETNVINTLGEAVRMVEEIGSPAVRTMFDVHNAADETEPHADLVRRYLPYIRHVHVNEPDGREPGRGSYDFDTLLAALVERGYDGWVSVEAFDFSHPPEEIAEGAWQRLSAETLAPSSVEVQ